MKKGFIFGLALLAGLSNIAQAAPTSLLISGDWTTVTGDIGTSFGVTWTYDTDLTTVPSSIPSPLPSGGTISSSHFDAPTYTLTGTGALSTFDGLPWTANLIDNSVAAIDATGIPGLIAQMSSHGLDPNMAGDILFMSNNYQDGGEKFSFLTMLIFAENFFSGPTLATGETLLEQSIFTYMTLHHTTDYGVEAGNASYIQSPSAVPVPAAAFMFAPALLGFLGFRRKNKV